MVTSIARENGGEWRGARLRSVSAAQADRLCYNALRALRQEQRRIRAASGGGWQAQSGRGRRHAVVRRTGDPFVPQGKQECRRYGWHS
jgi:hypothetical protein